MPLLEGQDYVVDTDRKLVGLHVNRFTPPLHPYHKAVVGGGRTVLFRYTDRNVVALRSVTNLPIPYPIETTGNFTSALFEADAAQRHMSTHLAMRKRAFCWADKGTGKSAVALWAAEWVKAHQGVGRVLVLAPKSSLFATWRNEILNICPNRTVNVIKGDRATKLDNLSEYADYTVCTHQSLLALRESILAQDWGLVIVDEHTFYRHRNNKRVIDSSDPNSKKRVLAPSRTNTLLQLAERPKLRMWLLSAEPTPNKPTDLYYPLRCVVPERVPLFESGFRDLVMLPTKSQFVYRPKPGWEDTLAKLVDGYAVQYRLDDVAHVPDAFYDTRKLVPSDEQQRLMAELSRESIAAIDRDGYVAATNAGVEMGKFLQIGAGVVTYKKWHMPGDEVTDIKELDCQPKLDLLEDTIETAQGPVIVFTPFLASVDMLAKWLTSKKYSFRQIDGRVQSDTKRSEAFAAVQNNEVQVLLANPSAMAHSITLTRSADVFWFGLTPDNEVFSQANGRIRRRTQTRKQHYTIPITNRVEKRVMDMLMAKSTGQQVMLDFVNDLRNNKLW